MKIFGIRRETRPLYNRKSLKINHFTLFFLPLFYFTSFSYAEDVLDEMVTEFLEMEDVQDIERGISKVVEGKIVGDGAQTIKKNRDEGRSKEGIRNVLGDGPETQVVSKQQSVLELMEALRKQPRSAELHYKIGRAYLDQGNTERAIKHLRIANYRQNDERLLWLSRAYEKAGQYKRQVKVIEIFLKKYSAGYDILLEFARAYLKNDETSRAISTFKKAISLEPKRKLAYVESIKAAELKGQSHELQILLEAMKKRFDKEPFVYNKFCKYYFNQSFYKNVEICREAIELDPDFAENHIYLGMAYIQREDIEKGSDLIFKTAKRFPSSSFAQKTAGDLSIKNQNWQRAAGYFSQCVRADNKHEYCFLELAKVKFQLEEYKTALSHFKSACDLQPLMRIEIRKAITKLIFKRKDNLKRRYEYVYQQCGKISQADLSFLDKKVYELVRLTTYF